VSLFGAHSKIMSNEKRIKRKDGEDTIYGEKEETVTEVRKKRTTGSSKYNRDDEELKYSKKIRDESPVGSAKGRGKGKYSTNERSSTKGNYSTNKKSSPKGKYSTNKRSSTKGDHSPSRHSSHSSHKRSKSIINIHLTNHDIFHNFSLLKSLNNNKPQYSRLS
jgi:hypothetical protein